MKTKLELTQAILAARCSRNGNGKKTPWRTVAKELYPEHETGAAAAMLSKIVKHPRYYPGEDACEWLGLVPKRLVTVCKTHGVFHDYDCETQKVVDIKPKNKPTKSRPRFRPDLGRVTDEQRKIILAMRPEERLRRLVG